MRMLALCAVLVTACAGSKKAPEEAGENGSTGTETGEEGGSSSGMEDIDTYEEIVAVFERKRPSVARCFSDAVRDGRLDKNRKGTLSLTMVITTGGKAENVQVASDTLKSPEVESCVLAIIPNWSLPKPTERLDFSFSYEFAGL